MKFKRIDPDSDERVPSPDARRLVGQCLSRAFAVGDAGSFTSLLRAIGDDTGDSAAPAEDGETPIGC